MQKRSENLACSIEGYGNVTKVPLTFQTCEVKSKQLEAALCRRGLGLSGLDCAIGVCRRVSAISLSVRTVSVILGAGSV